eukprot:TRINITY_DN21104_c0_g1_i2.p2 TRINITY_DN21104_c0_g1~~TRINITY_DN21104_c0_g1_i2.p2  ORF type:complete len:398 (+),score=48.23 TRINITY_DN21104_c0_g1_i2:1223-2416(+)
MNLLMRQPPEMRLPRLGDVVDTFLQAQYVVHTDARSFFYQFPLASGVRPFFCSRLTAERGPYTTVAMCSMPMGWCWAPAIAQRTSEVLLPRTEGLTWIDNFFVVANSEAEAAARYGVFRARCTEVGLELHEDEPGAGVPTQHFDALGMTFDLENGRNRRALSWVEKVGSAPEVQRVVGGVCTPREWYKVLGRVVWRHFATRTPLSWMPEALSYLRKVAVRVGEDATLWDTDIPVPESARANIEAAMHHLRENPWKRRRVAPVQQARVWTDASSTSWAAVLEHEKGDTVAQGTFPERWAKCHIYIKELLAAREGVALGLRDHAPATVHLFVDNLPAVSSIQRGHSSAYWGNKVIAEIYRLLEEHQSALEVTWVPTHQQRADRYTRGERAADVVAGRYI